MNHGKCALHLRTGDHGNAYAINAWLERHGIQVVNCRDALEACVVLLRQPALTPDWAFIGTQWLDGDDRPIVRYMRQTWPGVTIVLYGGALVELAGDRRTVVCRTSADLRNMLAGSPDDLLARSVRAPRPVDNPGEAGETHQATPEKQPLDRPLPPAGSDTIRPPGSDAAPPSILTRDELAALLDEE